MLRVAEPIADTILDVADRLLPWVVPIFLAVVFALGGPTLDVTATDEWMQLVALPVLLLAGTALLVDPPRARLTRAAMLAALAIACVPLLQLLPLPSSLRAMPDARAALAVDLASAGVDTPARWSLAPEATLRSLLALLPAQRQNLFFSATIPAAVQGLADGLLKSPVRVEVPHTPGNEPSIAQRAIAVDEARRTQLLCHLLKEHGWSRVLVFVATQYAAEHVAEKLYRAKIFATPFHGGLSQGARNQVLQEFKDERWQVVVTTDLAARGIDIAQLPAVVNYDLPRSAVDYVHRIGRTGRAGESGTAVSFVTADAEAHFRLIEKRQHLSLPLEQIEGFERTEVAPTPGPATDPDGTGGIKGKRPSKKDKLRAAAAAAGTAVISTAAADGTTTEPPATPADAAAQKKGA